MLAAAQENNQPITEQLWSITNPELIIEVGQANSVKDISPEVITLSLTDFFNFLNTPDPHNREKMSSCFLCGPCHGRKKKANIPYVNVCVLDADSSFDESMNIVDGAPDPNEVHKILKQLNITHHIYSTFSHGLKGNRYRVVFPLYATRYSELQAASTYFSELIQTQLPQFVLTPESFRWSQSWQYPRLRNEKASWYSATHWGYTLSAPVINQHYEFHNSTTPRIFLDETQLDFDISENTFDGQVEKYYPITQQLLDYDYTFFSQGTHVLADGEEQIIQRWHKPGADKNEAPGVVVFKKNGRQFVYSHYSNDVLANGKANTATQCFALISGASNVSKESYTGLLASVVSARIVEELNQKHPKVLLGGSDFKFVNIYDEESGGQSYKYMGKDSFFSLMETTPPVWLPTKDGETDNPTLTAMKRAMFWMMARDSEVYNGVRYVPLPMGQAPEQDIFSPSGKKYFNIFRDWGITPKEGSWDRLRWHLKYAICGGIDEEYEYLLDWFAHLVQKPYEKPGVAIVLQGGKGWGKSGVFSRLLNRFGTNSMVLSTTRQLSGDFNGHLQNKLTVLVEESFWSGDLKAEGPLKSLITDEDFTFEKKRETPVEAKSYTRVAMISNNEWVAPVTKDERRYFIPSICDAAWQANQTTEHNPRGDFFPDLYFEMDNGGVQAFYADMLKRDIRRSHIFKAPLTPKLAQQMTHTLAKEDAWVYDMLSTAEVRIPGKETIGMLETGTTVRVEDLERAMGQYLSSYERSRSTFNRLKTALDKSMPNSYRLMNTPGGSVIRFAGISFCRQDYQSKTKIQIDWPDSEIDKSFLSSVLLP